MLWWFCYCQLVIEFITPALEEKEAEGCEPPPPPIDPCEEDPTAEGCEDPEPITDLGDGGDEGEDADEGGDDGGGGESEE